MKLIVNGQCVVMENVITVADLLKVMAPSTARLAVLVNDLAVQKEARETSVLNENDRVEILTLAGGG